MIRFIASVGVALILGALMALAMSTIRAPRLVGLENQFDGPAGRLSCHGACK